MGVLGLERFEDNMVTLCVHRVIRELRTIGLDIRVPVESLILVVGGPRDAFCMPAFDWSAQYYDNRRAFEKTSSDCTRHLRRGDVGAIHRADYQTGVPRLARERTIQVK